MEVAASGSVLKSFSMPGGENDSDLESVVADLPLEKPSRSSPQENIPVNQKAQVNPESTSETNPSLKEDPKTLEPASNETVKKKRSVLKK